jgi:hypothetical protein
VGTVLEKKETIKMTKKKEAEEEPDPTNFKSRSKR